MATRLLLADDSVTIHKVVNLTFAAEDVSIEAVADGNLAIERAHNLKPDIVLADIFMPGRNGYEVCAAIKSDADLADTPVVLLVGTFEAFDEDEAARVKCDAYLTKPLDTSELVALVNDLVNKHNNSAVSEPQSDKESLPVSEGVEKKVEAASLLVSERARASFLGESRILDLFDAPVAAEAAAATARGNASLPTGATVAQGVHERQPGAPQVIPFPGVRNSSLDPLPVVLSEEVIDAIVEKVVKRMSEAVVREIAWEVVPELSEIMIRQVLNELKHR